MAIANEDRGTLREAMEALVGGNSRGFCDVMWLGFGDRWRNVLADLARGGFVAVLDKECNEGIRITDRGRALAANLVQVMRQTA